MATVQSLEQYITARSQVYRVQSVGHFDSGGPTARVEAVIDTNAGRPRIVYYRDLTGLGKGFNLPRPQAVRRTSSPSVQPAGMSLRLNAGGCAKRHRTI